MNPTYRKIQVDFLNRGDLQGDKKELTDAEWATQQKKNISDQKKRDKKATKDRKRAQAKEEKESKENTCPHCGKDRRRTYTNDDDDESDTGPDFDK